ncbi:UNVERIFIED_CONTAM: hypothetical protein Slati_3646700 [Sesamum latifolium]|uniref:Uncharacterized protein n=1 Tax=Sesamum latifolium TaxID=2727402 RepID=A0AAW2U021_9LAMI
MRSGVNTRKRSREAVLPIVEGGSFRDEKRRHLIDEDSDIPSAEVAMQPRHSP